MGLPPAPSPENVKPEVRRIADNPPQNFFELKRLVPFGFYLPDRTGQFVAIIEVKAPENLLHTRERGGGPLSALTRVVSHQHPYLAVCPLLKCIDDSVASLSICLSIPVACLSWQTYADGDDMSV